jgi:hypothetical protein
VGEQQVRRFEAFLTEEETEAHKKAIAMGLEYRGFGYWADKNTGEITHRSSGDELIPTKGLEAEGGSDAKLAAAMGNLGTDAAAGLAAEVEQGEVLPGEEKAEEDTNWEPGPDGSTDVGKDKEKVESDVFVGKSNSQGWEAGPDGSNVKNWSFDQFQEAALSEGAGTDMADILFGSNATAVAKKNKRRKPAAQEAKERGLVSDGHGMWFDREGTPMAKTVNGELEWLDGNEREQEQAKIVARNMRKAPGQEFTGDEDARAGAKFMQQVPAGKRTDMMGDYLKDKGLDPQLVDPKFNPLAAKGKVPAMPEPGVNKATVPAGMGREDQIKRLNDRDSGGERTYRDAIAALDKMSPEDREAALKDLAKTKPDEFRGMNQGEYTKGMKAYRDIQKLPAKGKDLEKVKGMNEAAQQFLSDPKYDMGEGNRHHELGSGAFGTVHLSKQGDVIKEGDIGRDELEALFLMKDHPAFPTLLNAQFDTPFKHQSTSYNNPMGRESQAADTQGRYFVPGEQSEFERKFVTARGTYAMSMAEGSDVADALYGVDEYTQEKVTGNFWDARADLHKAGIAHGDMHGGNVFVDLDDDDMPVSILDLGLAQVSKLAALMEGMGGLSEEDYQLSNLLSRNNLEQEKWDRLDSNYEALKERVMDDYRDHIAAGDLSEFDIEEFVRGGIRMSEEELGELLTTYEFEEDQLQEYLDILYDGFGSKPKDKRSDLEKRMAAAWEGLWDEKAEGSGYSGEGARGIIKNANALRKERGEGPINVKGLDLDEDD